VASLIKVGNDVKGSAYVEVDSRVPIFDLHRSAELGYEGPREVIAILYDFVLALLIG